MPRSFHLFKLLSVFFCVICLAAPADGLSSTASNIIQQHVPNAKPVGTGRMRFWFWSVYDATLYAPHGTWRANRPYALKLDYLRALNGKAIADRSAEEIRKLGFADEARLAVWLADMRTIFPDVDEGRSLTGIYHPKLGTRFYDGGRSIGRIADPEFGRWFFGIWLSKKTSAPDLRAQLLGF